jgi:hypothetical protein
MRQADLARLTRLALTGNRRPRSLFGNPGPLVVRATFAERNLPSNSNHEPAAERDIAGKTFLTPGTLFWSWSMRPWESVPGPGRARTDSHHNP